MESCRAVYSSMCKEGTALLRCSFRAQIFFRCGPLSLLRAYPATTVCLAYHLCFYFLVFSKFCLCLPIIYVWLVRTVETDGKYTSTSKPWLVVNGAGRKTPAGPQQKTFPYSWVGKPIFFFTPFFTGDVCSTRLLNRDISPTPEADVKCPRNSLIPEFVFTKMKRSLKIHFGRDSKDTTTEFDPF